MEDPHTPEEWRAILGTLIERNGGGDQYVYWQVTRGAEFGRNHAPLPKLPRTVFAFCAPLPATPPAVLETGLACVTAAGHALGTLRHQVDRAARERAAAAAGGRRHAGETILLRDGELTEASASAVHVVLGGEVLRAAQLAPHPARHHALGGGGDGGARRRRPAGWCR